VAELLEKLIGKSFAQNSTFLQDTSYLGVLEGTVLERVHAREEMTHLCSFRIDPPPGEKKGGRGKKIDHALGFLRRKNGIILSQLTARNPGRLGRRGGAHLINFLKLKRKKRAQFKFFPTN
jgi:hypothetical protein